MDYFGINSAADLPKIREVLSEQIVEGTIMSPHDFTDLPVEEMITEEETVEEKSDSDISAITVNEEGELIIKNEAEEEEKKDEGTTETSE